MKQFIKMYWKTILFFTVIGLVGGFFVSIDLLDNYPVELQQMLMEQGISKTILGLVNAIQSAGYGLVLGAIGIWISKKIYAMIAHGGCHIVSKIIWILFV